MRTLRHIILVVFLLGTGLGVYGYIRAHGYLTAPVGSGEPVAFVVAQGATVDQVTDQLVDQGLVTDRTVFSLYARYRKLGAKLQAGTHRIDPKQTPRVLVDTLMGTGASVDVEVTVPEGLTKWEVADVLAQAGLVERAAFLAQVDAQGLEGRLFPDTYRFRPNAGHGTVLDRMTRRFEAIAKELKGPAERKAWVTMASLIEAEAQTDRDRKLVSRVFQNRLAKKMRLQTDPTCTYGPDTYAQKPTRALCRDPKSRYSTYVIDGLPPTPICNPGRAALQAALHPADGPGTADLLYFVAKQDGSGEHVFNASYEDHKAAVNKYLRR